MNPSDSSLNCFAKSCHVMWIILLLQLPGSRGRHPVVSWDDCCRVHITGWSHPTVRSSSPKSLDAVTFLLVCYMFSSLSWMAKSNLSYFSSWFYTALNFCSPLCACLLLCFFLCLWWPLMNSVEQLGRKKPLWNLRGQLIIIMPTQADKGRWGRALKFPLFSTVRPDKSGSSRPLHSSPHKLGEASEPIWGQVNQHCNRGSAGLLLIISPENVLYHAFGSLTLQPIVDQPQSSAPLCWCECEFSLKQKDLWQQHPLKTPNNLPQQSKWSCFTLLSAKTIRPTMSGHIMYSMKGSCRSPFMEYKWTYVE